MLAKRHRRIVGAIGEIANRLRGPYRPPRYRLVMLPIVVLRRLDCVLQPTKAAVLAEHARLIAAGTVEEAIPKLLTRVVDARRKQPLYNTSPYMCAPPPSATRRSSKPRAPTRHRTSRPFLDECWATSSSSGWDGNGAIFNRVMSDPAFRDAAGDHLAREIYDRARRGEAE